MAEWTNRNIELDQLEEFEKWAQALIRTGDDTVENLWCVYYLKDDPKIIYTAPLLTYVDNPITKDECDGFFLYQMVN